MMIASPVDISSPRGLSLSLALALISATRACAGGHLTLPSNKGGHHLPSTGAGLNCAVNWHQRQQIAPHAERQRPPADSKALKCLLAAAAIGR